MSSILSELRNMSALRRELKNPTYKCGRIFGEENILEVRQFCYSVYCQRGEIERELLNGDGVLGPDKDPYARHSVYFAVRAKDSSIVAASRLILPSKGRGVDALQADVADLPADARAYLESFGQSIAEPASFAKAHEAPSVATIYLIREMLHYSVDCGIKEWFLALNPRIEHTYRRRFGPALQRLGDRVSSKVDLGGRRPVNVPYAMDVQHALGSLERGNILFRLFVAPTIRNFMRVDSHRVVAPGAVKAKPHAQLSR